MLLIVDHVRKLLSPRSFRPALVLSIPLTNISESKQCYEAAIAACSKAKKWEYATDLFRKAEEKFDNNAATLQPMYLLLMVTVRQTYQGHSYTVIMQSYKA